MGGMNMAMTVSGVNPGAAAAAASGVAKVESRDLGWQKGDVYQGTVMGRLSNNTYAVRVEGRDIIVQSPYALPVGGKVAMEVQGRQEGQYLVKLMTSHGPGQEELLKNLLDQLCIKDTPLNRNLIQGFLKQELPLRPELLQLAERLVQRLGGNNPENIEKALLGLKMGILPEPRVLDAVHSFLSGMKDSKQGGEVQQLALFMHKLTGFLGDETGAPQPPSSGMLSGDRSQENSPVVLSKSGNNLFLQLQEALQNLTLDPQKGVLKVAEQLRALINAQLPQGGAGSAVPPSAAGPEEPPQESVLPQVKVVAAQVSQKGEGESFAATPLLRPGAEAQKPLENRGTAEGGLPLGKIRESALKSTPGEAPAPIHKTPEQNSENSAAPANSKEVELQGQVKPREFGRLLQVFGRLLQEVREAVKEAGSPVQGQRLLQEGTVIERQMAGQQIFQALNKVDDPQDYLYFNLPFARDGEGETWGQLKIIKEGGKKKAIDPAHFSLALMLNTVGLGPLLLELKVRDKEVMAGGKVTEDRVAGLLKDSWPKLQDAFDEMGYHLHPCFWKVGSLGEDLRPKGLNRDNSDGKLRILDVSI